MSKLTPQQIATLHHLKSNGAPIHIIGATLEREYGISKSTAYYHLSDNRESYCNLQRKIRQERKLKIKELIHQMIQQGQNTKQIADGWNMELEMVNKLYST